MSFDIYLRTPECPTCAHAESVYDWNLTHNLNQMLESTFLSCTATTPLLVGKGSVYQERSWGRLDGHTAKDALPLLAEASKELLTRPDTYRRLEASNGWGRYESLVKVLNEVVMACAENPHLVFRTSG
jgi:hypothetical protein